jgi:hypothetical protein
MGHVLVCRLAQQTQCDVRRGVRPLVQRQSCIALWPRPVGASSPRDSRPYPNLSAPNDRCGPVLSDRDASRCYGLDRKKWAEHYRLSLRASSRARSGFALAHSQPSVRSIRTATMARHSRDRLDASPARAPAPRRHTRTCAISDSRHSLSTAGRFVVARARDGCRRSAAAVRPVRSRPRGRREAYRGLECVPDLATRQRLSAERARALVEPMRRVAHLGLAPTPRCASASRLAPRNLHNLAIWQP